MASRTTRPSFTFPFPLEVSQSAVNLSILLDNVAAFPIPVLSLSSYILIIILFDNVAAFPVLNAVAHLVPVCVGVELGERKCALCAFVSSWFMVLQTTVLGSFFCIFPIPYFMVICAFPTAIFLFVNLFYLYPASLRDGSEFRTAYFKTFLVCCWNVVSALSFVFYNSVFQNMQGSMQSAFSLLLPVLKFAYKMSTKWFVSQQLNNPDGAHAAAFFTECCAGVISAVIFTSIGDPITFCLIVIVDVAENLFYAANILAEIIKLLRATIDGSLEKIGDEFRDALTEQEEDGSVEEASTPLVITRTKTAIIRRNNGKSFDVEVSGAVQHFIAQI